MVPQLIRSVQHPFVKKWVKLRKSRSFRNQEGVFLVIGETLIQEISSVLPLEALISTKPLPFPAKRKFLVSEPILKKIMGFSTPDPVVAEVALPHPSSLKDKKKIIVLDQIADPGNVGTLLRTALGLGWDGVFFIYETADPFNDKAIRAARGAALFLSFAWGSWGDLMTLIQLNGINLYIADVAGNTISRDSSYKEPLALLLGHETRGTSARGKEIGEKISIPMTSRVESLNVAAAGAIFMYQISSNFV